MTAADTDARAREIAAGLDDEGVHCMRRVAYCERMHVERNAALDDVLRDWASSVAVWHRVPRSVFDAMVRYGLVVAGGGAHFTDLGRAVARVLASQEVDRG